MNAKVKIWSAIKESDEWREQPAEEIYITAMYGVGMVDREKKETDCNDH